MSQKFKLYSLWTDEYIYSINKGILEKSRGLFLTNGYYFKNKYLFSIIFILE